MKWYENIFFFGLVSTYLLITAIILGFGKDRSSYYLSTLNYFMKIYVCVLILLRFNPFVSTRFSEFDRRLVFTSALFLLSTITIEEIMVYYEQANSIILNQ